MIPSCHLFESTPRRFGGMAEIPHALGLSVDTVQVDESSADMRSIAQAVGRLNTSDTVRKAITSWVAAWAVIVSVETPICIRMTFWVVDKYRWGECRRCMGQRLGTMIGNTYMRGLSLQSAVRA